MSPEDPAWLAAVPDRRERVLVVGPHRDDEAIGCGGSIAWHVGRGDMVSVVHLCSGVGACDGEAAEAAAILGVSQVIGLAGPPVSVAPSEESLRALVRVYRAETPTIVYAPHRCDDDPSHRAAAILAVEAAWLAAYPVFLDEGPPMAAPPAHVLGYEVWSPIPSPALIRDITAVADRKRRAIGAYHSQLERVAWDKGALGLNAYRGVTSGAGAYAEAFEVLRPVVHSAVAGVAHESTDDMADGR